jgi:hypothetical protein
VTYTASHFPSLEATVVTIKVKMKAGIFYLPKDFLSHKE